MLNEILDFAIAIAGADFGSIQLVNATSGELEIQVQRGFPDWWVHYWNTLGRSAGSCATALKRGERVIVEDVERSPIFINTPALAIQLQAGVRGVQSTPIVSRSGKYLGMFSTHYRQPCRLDERTLELLDLLAAQAAELIERLQAEKDLAQANQELQADLEALGKLQEISTLFVREGDIRPVLEKMLQVAIDFSRADFGMIHLVDSTSGGLKLVAQRSFPPWWVDFWDTVIRGQGAAGAALEKGERIIVEDIEKSPIFLGTPALDIQLRAGVRAVQATPLVSREGKLLGMLVTHYKVPQHPNEKALNLIDVLARQAADIIDRSHLNQALANSLASLAQREEALRELNQILEQRITERTRELAGAKVKLQMMTRRYAEAQEVERRRLAREIHDRVSSALTAVGLSLGLIAKEINADHPVIKERLLTAKQLLADTISVTREISHDLHPAALELGGILAALKEYARKFSAQTGIAVDLIGDEDVRLPPQIEVALFRIAQEALTNCAKHADSRIINIILVNDAEMTELVISDDGVGFDKEAAVKKAGLGLLSMRERAAAVGGKLIVDSTLGGGTRITIELPHLPATRPHRLSESELPLVGPGF